MARTTKEIKRKLENLGFNCEAGCNPEKNEVWEEKGHLFFSIDPDDITGYTMEVDPETGKSRHCGNGRGCFWTEWE